MTAGTRVRALRGATSAAANDQESISAATEELLAAMLERNSVDPGEVVSVFFTATPDLDASYPAEAARRMGLATTPLLCASEMAVAGALPRCIRVLMHLYTDLAPEQLRHVYLREARSLRTDLADQ